MVNVVDTMVDLDHWNLWSSPYPNTTYLGKTSGQPSISYMQSFAVPTPSTQLNNENSHTVDMIQRIRTPLSNETNHGYPIFVEHEQFITDKTNLANYNVPFCIELEGRQYRIYFMKNQMIEDYSLYVFEMFYASSVDNNIINNVIGCTLKDQICFDFDFELRVL